MANQKMTFSVGIKTTYDAAGVNKLKNDLTSLSKLATNKNFFGQFSTEAPGAIQAANTLKAAISQAYNPKLGTATLDRFNKSIAKSGMSLKEIQEGLHAFGTKGDMAFVNATSSLLRMDSVARRTNTTFDKLFTTFKNTLTWGLSSALWRGMTGSLQKTYYYIKDIDTALNDIRIVTGKSNEEMAQFAKNANDAAKALGTSTKNYTEGSLIYYQQGLSDEEVKTRTDITAKTAAVTGQSMSQVSEQLTAVWNGYKVSAGEAELYVDRLAAVAATTASDLEELSTSMSKVASAAANLGVSESQLSAILATTISVTRQAPESVGTAYKTIFARISDIKAGLDTETTFGNYTSKMAEMGISVLDTTGNLRDMGEVIEEIGRKWGTMSREQQITLAQTMAGTRQYNNLVALFDNWSNYEETLKTAENAAGTLAEQHNIALDSLNNRLNILKATWEDFYQGLIESNDIKSLITTLTQLVQILADATEAAGGLKTILPSVVSLFLQMGASRIGKELGSLVYNFVNIKNVADDSAIAIANFEKQLKADLPEHSFIGISDAQQQAVEGMVNYYKEILQYKNIMTEEDMETYEALKKQQTELAEISITYDEIKTKAQLGTTGSFAKMSKEDKEIFSLLSDTKSFDLGTKLSGEVNLDEINRIASSLRTVATDYQYMIKGMSDTELAERGLDILNNSIDNIKGTGEITEQEIEALKNKFNEFASKGNESGEAAKKMATYLNVLAETTEAASNGVSTLDDRISKLKQDEANFSSYLNIKALISDFTTLAGVISSVGMSMSLLNSLTKTWADESLSGFEKMVRTLTSVGMLLPSILQTVKTITNTIQTIKGFNFLPVVTKIEDGVAKVVKVSTTEMMVNKGILATKQQITAEEEKQNTLLDAKAKKEAAIAAREKANQYRKEIENEMKFNPLAGRPDSDEEKQKWLKGMQGKKKWITRYDNQAKNAENIANEAAKKAEEMPGAQGTGAPGLIGLIASAPQAAAVLAGVVVVLAAIAGSIALVNEHQKRVTQKSLEELKTIKEKNDARKEEVDKLNELATSYSNLKTQLDEGKITEKDYRNQVLALTEGIEDQTLKLKMLRGEYEDFGKTLQDVTAAQNEVLIQGYDEEIKKAKSTMNAANVQGTNTSQDLWKAFTGAGGALNFIPGYGTIGSIGSFVKGIGTDNQVISRSLDFTANSEFKKYIKENDIGQFLKTGGPGGYQLHIEDEDIVEAYEAIDKAIQDNAHLANTETIKELTTIRDNMKEAYEIQKDAQTQRNELLKKNLIYDVDTESINSAEKYSEAVADLTQKAIDNEIFGKDEYEQARIWANGALSAINDEAIEWSKKEGIVDTLLSSIDLSKFTEEERNQLIAGLQELPEEELKLVTPIFFTLGQQDGKSYLDGVKDYVSKHSNLLDLQRQALAKNKIASAISIANEKGTFNNEESQKLLEGINLDGTNAKGEEYKFSELNFGNQMLVSLVEQAKAGLTPEQAEELRAGYQEQLDEAQKIFDEEQEKAITESLNKVDWFNTNVRLQDDAGNNISDFDTEGNIINMYTGELIASHDAIENLAVSYKKAGNSTKDFSKEQVELWNTLKDAGIIQEDNINNLEVENDGLTLAQQNIDALTAAIEGCIEGQQDWNTVQVQAEKVLENYNGYLDDLQSSYKTLAQAEKEWNLNEGFSVDTLQSLLKMNPMYIEALEMEGNQFKVNTERLNEVAHAEGVAAVNAAELARISIWQQAIDTGKIETVKNLITNLDNLAGATNDVTSANWALAKSSLAAMEGMDAETLKAATAAMDREARFYEKGRTIAMNTDLTKDTKKSGKSSKKDEKNYKDEFDRYWEFLKAIEKVGNAIEKLNKQEKNLFGKEKISLLKNKNQLLKQQVQTYNDLYEEQKREQSELMGTLGGKGVTFNAEGEITNYAQKTSEALATYNAAVAKYNSGMLSEDAFKVAEKAYESFKKEIDRYDKLYYDEMKDTMDKIDDINREVLANNLSAWEIEIKLKIDWESLQREWMDFLHDINEDFTQVYADLSANLANSLSKAQTYTKSSGTLETDLQAIYDVMHEIDKLDAGGQSDMFESISQAQEKLKTLNSDLMKDSNDLYKLWQDAYKTYLEGIDQLNDKFEEQMGYYERIDKELDHQKKLIGLLYGDEAYDMMNTLYKNQEKNQLAEIDSLKRQRDIWEEQWKKAEEGSQEQLKYYQLMINAQDDLNSSVEEYIKLLQNDAVNALDNILKNYNNWVTNGQGLDALKADWDDMTKYIDKYYDSVESVYHVESLASKMREGIDNQDSLTAQKKLQDLYDKEITYLKEKENLTEYDIKAAEQRYNIALKEIALQEAQEAKNSMKVTRDTNGNWTYQYVADTSEEEKRKQELSDEIYKLYELANDAYNDNLSNLLTLQEEYLSRMREIETEEIETGKDMTAERDKLNQWYFDNYQRLAQENLDYQRDMADAGTGVLKDAYDRDIYQLTDFTETQQKLIKAATEANIQDFEDLSTHVENNLAGMGDLTKQMLAETVPEWTAGAREMADAWNADDGVSIKSQVVNSTQEMIDMIYQYRDSLDDLEATAGVDFTQITQYINDTTDATDELRQMVEDLCDTSDLDNYKLAVDAMRDAWYGVKNSITDAIKEIERYLQLAGKASNMQVSTNLASAGYGKAGDTTGNNGSDTTTINKNTNNSQKATWWSIDGNGNVMIGNSKGQFATLNKNADSSSKEEWKKQYNNLEFDATKASSKATEPFAQEWANYMSSTQGQGSLVDFLKRRYDKMGTYLNMFDTGGYTGDWTGGDGRLALLHSKELVLNQEDTVNFLSAVNMIRDIASFGNSIEDSIMAGIDSFVTRFSGGYGTIKNTTDNSKQNIFNINAPITSTATTDEIQQAILGLPNLASQYVARNGF